MRAYGCKRAPGPRCLAAVPGVPGHGALGPHSVPPARRANPASPSDDQCKGPGQRALARVPISRARHPCHGCPPPPDGQICPRRPPILPRHGGTSEAFPTCTWVVLPALLTNQRPTWPLFQTGPRPQAACGERHAGIFHKSVPTGRLQIQNTPHPHPRGSKSSPYL
jgi:hypothetical protein